jgi:hypothetical protein
MVLANSLFSLHNCLRRSVKGGLFCEYIFGPEVAGFEALSVSIGDEKAALLSLYLSRTLPNSISTFLS